MLLHIVCITLITAPFIFFFVRLQWNFWCLSYQQQELLQLLTFLVTTLTLFQNTWGVDYFVKRGIFTLKRKSAPFFLTALHKLIFTFKMVTRNQRTLRVAVGPTTSASFIAVRLSLCITRPKVTHPHLFCYPCEDLGQLAWLPGDFYAN